jgi:hypothetical protein
LNDEITNNQIQMVMQTLVFASLLLLPILSQPLTWLASERCLKKSDWFFKWALASINFGLGFTFCVLAGYWCSEMTVSYQFCLVAGLSIAIVIGTFGWNMLRIVMNWVLSPFRS